MFSSRGARGIHCSSIPRNWPPRSSLLAPRSSPRPANNTCGNWVGGYGRKVRESRVESGESRARRRSIRCWLSTLSSRLFPPLLPEASCRRPPRPSWTEPSELCPHEFRDQLRIEAVARRARDKTISIVRADAISGHSDNCQPPAKKGVSSTRSPNARTKPRKPRAPTTNCPMGFVHPRT
jgi:hypothetical protein